MRSIAGGKDRRSIRFCWLTIAESRSWRRRASATREPFRWGAVSDSGLNSNPTRPAARVRYSVAHEIAHTLFADCAAHVRHRAARAELSGDEWQLEALCNVAAAELLMPLGSFPNLREESMTIERLVQLRRTYAVSNGSLVDPGRARQRSACGGLRRVSHREGNA